MREILHNVYQVNVSENGKDIGYGSCFVTLDGYVRTAWHVVIDPTKSIHAYITSDSGKNINISLPPGMYIQYEEYEYKIKLSDHELNRFNRIAIAQNKPKRNDVVYIAGIKKDTRPIVIKSTVIDSKYERFSLKLPAVRNYHGFSGGLVTNTRLEAVGVINGQLGESTSDQLFCQFITPDKYQVA